MAGVMVPTRRRRRPALSCSECRRRKIKCDRKLPCNHCTQTPSVVCSYQDGYPPVANRRTAPKAPPTPSSVNIHHRPRITEVPGSTDSLARSVPSLVEDGSQSGRASWNLTPGSTTVGNSPSETKVPSGVNQARSLEQSLLGNKGEQPNWVMGLSFSTFEDVIIQDGDERNTLRTKVFTDSNSTPIHDLKGTLCKTRFFGQSHWMNSFKQFPPICRFDDADGTSMAGYQTAGVREALEMCKRIARAAKAERPIKWHTNPNFRDYIPPRETADKLVNLYLRTCESTYRILHIPSFMGEYNGYWGDPTKAPTSLAVKILLVMAIGTSFYQEAGNDELRTTARQWVYSAQSWTAAPFEKGRLNICGIEISCLLLLARQTNAVGGDLIWTASGTLLRTAFSMGFHRDPKHFPKIPIFVAEMRRRIWATVLEMAVQASLDAGMPPLITAQDFDTEPPANINDEDISVGTIVMPYPKPDHVYTQTSIQIALLKSLRTRLEVVHIVNSFYSEPSYDRVLHFDHDITKACNDTSRLMNSYPASLPRPTAFHRNLLDIFVRRFLLDIHNPFSFKAQADPRYYFSRKVCLEVALAIFFQSGAEDLPPEHDPHIVDDYARLRIVGGGMFKDIIFHAVTIITVDLLRQLGEDAASGLPPSVQNAASREPQYRAVRDMVDLAAERIRAGENNVKGHLFLSAAAAQIHAMTNGTPIEEAVPAAAKRSAELCLEILTARAKLGPELPEEGTPESVDTREIEEPEFSFDMLMPDANMDFEIPDSWIFTGWDMN